MPTCTPPGWGSQGWGWASFGGGGPLSNEFPTHAPFDVYCVGPCDEMKNILTYQPEQFSSGLIIDPLTENLVLLAAPADAERWLLVNKSVPDFWTLEYTVIFTQLPPISPFPSPIPIPLPHPSSRSFCPIPLR